MATADEIIGGLMSRGLPQHIAIGIAANMKAESGFNPGINEQKPLVAGSRGGYGLNQWTGPRRRAYEAYAAEQGNGLADLGTQLDYTLWELQNTERGAWNALAGADNASEAARIYSDKFLRPGIPHMDARLRYAAELSGGQYEPSAAQYTQAQPGQNALAQQPQQQPQPIPQAQYLDPRDFMTQQNALAPVARFTTQYMGA